MRRRVPIQEYLDEKKPRQSPDAVWWILLHIFNDVMSIVDVCFRSLQGKSTLLVEQEDRLNMCVKELKKLVNMQTYDPNSPVIVLVKADATIQNVTM